MTKEGYWGLDWDSNGYVDGVESLGTFAGGIVGVFFGMILSGVVAHILRGRGKGTGFVKADNRNIR